DVTFDLGGSKTISAAILYGSLADNDKCTPLEYDVLMRSGGTWQKVDEVRVPADGKTLRYGNITRLTWYDNPWIFVHRFKPDQVQAGRGGRRPVPLSPDDLRTVPDRTAERGDRQVGSAAARRAARGPGVHAKIAAAGAVRGRDFGQAQATSRPGDSFQAPPGD